MYVILAFIVGVIVGSVVAAILFGRKAIGCLRVDQSDKDEAPYLFLELTKNIPTFRHKKFVVMRVKNENFISHE